MTHNPDNITIPSIEDTTILGEGKGEIEHKRNSAFVPVPKTGTIVPSGDTRTDKRRQIAIHLATMFDDDFRAAKGFYLGHAENIMQIVEA